MLSTRCGCALAPSLLLLALAGCHDASSTPAHDEFRTVATLYQRFTSDQHRPPRDEAEFKQYISANGAPLLEAHGIANVDELFVSSRDGQPITIVYAPDKAKYGQVIAFEQTGVEGKRMVADSLGAVGLADEAEFRELTNPAGGA